LSESNVIRTVDGFAAVSDADDRVLVLVLGNGHDAGH